MTSGKLAAWAALLLLVAAAAYVVWRQWPTPISVPVPAAAGQGDRPAGVRGSGISPFAPTTSRGGDRTVFGTVFDADTGEPVPGAVLVLIAESDDGDGDELQTMEADEEGSYAFDVPGGTLYEGVRCSADGYGATRRRVTPEHGVAPRIDFRLHPEAVIAGTIVDADAGQGMRGIRISARPHRSAAHSDPGVGASAVTDEDGAYRITGLEPGSYNLIVDGSERDVVSAELKPAFVTLQAGETLEGADLVVEPAAVVAGTVRDGEGRPVAGARLRAMPTPVLEAALKSGAEIQAKNLVAKALSDDSGEYALRGLRFDTDYRILIRAEGHVRAAAGPLRVPSGQSPYALDLTIAGGSVVSGVVRHVDGRPAEGVDVSLLPELDALLGDDDTNRLIARTEAGGVFRFEGVPAGLYTLGSGSSRQAGPAYYSNASEPRHIEVDGVDEVAGIEFDLPPGALDPQERKVTGVVVDGSDAPVAQARVYIKTLGARVNETQSGTTDGDGAFVFEGLNGATFALAAVADAGRADLDDIALGDDLRVVLAPGGEVRGTVFDAAGAPAGACDVVLHAEDRDGIWEARVGGGDAAQTDSDGAFRFANLAAGTYRVEAWSGSKVRGSAIVTVGPREAVETTVRLNPGVRYAGRVRDMQGAPVEGAAVKLVPRDQDESLGAMSEILVVTLPGKTATTDVDGAFAIEGLQPGVYKLTVSHEGFANAPAQSVEIGDADVTGVDVVLSAGGRIRGNYKLGEDPMAYKMLQLVGPGGVYTVTTDVDGAYNLDRITPGEYVVQVFDPAQLAVGNFMGMQIHQQVVEIVEGQDGPLDLGPRGHVTLAGRIEGADAGDTVSILLRRPGGPAPEEVSATEFADLLEAARYQAGQAVRDVDGVYTIKYLEPGTYILEVYVASAAASGTDVDALSGEESRGPRLRREIVVPDEESVELNFVLDSVAVVE